jgi:hypothetical protein
MYDIRNRQILVVLHISKKNLFERKIFAPTFLAPSKLPYIS